ncbi:MAG: type IV pilin protein [Gammaproteobacteria bacterium]|nr:type IV pilin protein [Gammaproteobacteria bacterium]
MKFNTRQRGVTLIELVVVMMIVGILAAIAIPSYRAYVLRSQRSDAQDALLALATQQEKFYLQCNIYATGCAAAPNCAGPNLQGTNSSKNGWYTLTIPVGNVTSYTISATATAGGNQFQDVDCRTFLVTDRGIRTAANSGGAANTAECWR